MGIDIRQEISLVGALSYVKDDIYIYIIIPGKNKTILNCKSTSMEDANIWNKHIIDEIARSNITALQNSSRYINHVSNHVFKYINISFI